MEWEEMHQREEASRFDEAQVAKGTNVGFMSTGQKGNAKKAWGDSSQVPQPRGDMITKENLSPNQLDYLASQVSQSFQALPDSNQPFMPVHHAMTLPP